ncbi:MULTISPECIES: PP2C family protein-serine/threonine phosphatase [Streptomyces diastaticus group]|uniref:Protein phosphatase n=2 Tax=Streptomyces diastaticus group TaxID=2849069 RepID=A0ABX6RLA7_9ACTN|nr:PP2C family serine/threonine-protein phosphatase [Streptomyces rutgersensis]QNE81161.1 protein phosphatase [Streptomyces rutgersensis]WSU37862.1 serine/threonine-protein phosphatase [Streptomyces gougerotii]
MSRIPQLSACPSCEEPLEPADHFCGACGFDLSSVPEPPRGRPDAVSPDGPPAEGGRGAPVAWPAAPPVPPSAAPGETSPLRGAEDLPGTDPAGAPPAGPPAATADAAVPDGPAPDAPAGAPAPAPGPWGAPPAATRVPGARDGEEAAGSAPVGEQGDFALAEPGAAPPAPPAPPATSGPPTLVDPAPSARAAEEGAGVSPAGGGAPADPRTTAAGAPGGGGRTCVACRAGRVDPDGYCENCGHAQPRERDHMEEEIAGAAAVSDRGLRHHRNEDAFALASAPLPDGSPAVVAIVCDGVSSATRPDEASLAASRAATDSLVAALGQGTHPQTAMHEAIVAAARAVDGLAEERPADADSPRQNAPACTIVGAVAAGGLLVVGWIGDSRVYWVPADREGPVARLTEDDSWAAQMVAAGLMSEAEAHADSRAHAITGWLGADAYELDPHTASFKPDRPGVAVVCSDGLWNYAESAEEMAAALPADALTRPLHSAQVLAGHALDGGGHDNVTVAVVPFDVRPREDA